MHTTVISNQTHNDRISDAMNASKTIIQPSIPNGHGYKRKFVKMNVGVLDTDDNWLGGVQPMGFLPYASRPSYDGHALYMMEVSIPQSSIPSIIYIDNDTYLGTILP